MKIVVRCIKSVIFTEPNKFMYVYIIFREKKEEFEILN